MPRVLTAPLALLLALLLLAGVADAQPAPAPLGPPDPRQGERLDGRTVPKDPLRRPRALARAALSVPRWLLEGLFWPIVKTAAFVERRHLLARIYWKFTSEDGLVGLRPEAQYETGLVTSVGLRFFDRRALGVGSLVQVRGRTAGPRFLLGEFKLRSRPVRPGTIELRALFERDPDALFGGTHGETRADLRAAGLAVTHYRMDRAFGALSLERRAGPLAALLRGELDLRDYRALPLLRSLYGDDQDGTVDDTLVPGFDEGLRLARLRAGLRLDTRRTARRVGGVRLALDGTLAQGVLGDPSLHARAVADARLVVDLRDRALIVRANAGLVAPLGDAPVPFEELMSPSGNDGLRGLSSGRLRGQSQLFGSLEYRWLLTPYVDAALFVDEGGAFDAGFDGLSFARMIPSYGFGLRIHELRGDYWNAAPLLWLQLAHAPDEGVRFIIRLGGGD